MSEIYNTSHASSWLSVSWLRKLRGPVCSLRVFVQGEVIEIKSSSLCAMLFKKFGLINQITMESIVSVDLKDNNRVELIFNPNKYIEQKLNIYTDNADKLMSAIQKGMEYQCV